MTDVLVLDLDWTLVDCQYDPHWSWLPPFLRSRYLGKSIDTPPHLGLVDFNLRMRAKGCETAIVTARTDVWRSRTLRWLEHHHINHEYLFMRRVWDRRSDGEYKLACARKLESMGLYVIMAFDDNDEIRQAYWSGGIRAYNQVGDP